MRTPKSVLALVLVLAACCCALAGDRTAGVSLPEFALTRFGEIKPSGWMLRQMQADLDDGLAGHYTDISDTVNMQVFKAQTGDVPDAAGEPGWWLGEHEGYYADGLFRLAWFAGSDAIRQAAIARLEAVLATQDSTGYIGVYPASDRLGNQIPNDGELWTQSRMFQALLAWYEATGDQRILDAVGKAVKVTLAAYQNKSYFERQDTDGGGVSHGIGFSDTLEWMYRLTGDDAYRAGYLWLYADYASSNAIDDDLKPSNLSDPNRPWYMHTPHIAEGLSMPAIAYAYGGPSLYAQAADQVLNKLHRHSNPGGGPIGDESVDGRSSSFELNSEYCSMTETIASLNRVAQYRDAMATGDIAERIAFNSAQGARIHTAATAVSYLTADNRLSATETTIYADRLLYSASHEAAACCSLNSTRLLPYYVEGMWLKQTNGAGLAARLYGPSSVDTTVGGVPVSVIEETDYPFSQNVLFTIYPQTATTFTLTLRIPDFAQGASVVAPAGATVVRLADRFQISATWNSGDTVALDLAFAVHTVQDAVGQQALAYGPLLYALPLDAIATPGRITRAEDGASAPVFQDTEFTLAQPAPTYLLPRDANFAVVSFTDGDVLDPWNKPPNGLSGSLLAPDGTRASVTLRPLGATLLRIAGFPTDEIFSDSAGG